MVQHKNIFKLLLICLVAAPVLQVQAAGSADTVKTAAPYAKRKFVTKYSTIGLLMGVAAKTAAQYQKKHRFSWSLEQSVALLGVGVSFGLNQYYNGKAGTAVKTAAAKAEADRAAESAKKPVTDATTTQDAKKTEEETAAAQLEAQRVADAAKAQQQAEAKRLFEEKQKADEAAERARIEAEAAAIRLADQKAAEAKKKAEASGTAADADDAQKTQKKAEELRQETTRNKRARKLANKQAKAAREKAAADLLAQQQAAQVAEAAAAEQAAREAEAKKALEKQNKKQQQTLAAEAWAKKAQQEREKADKLRLQQEASAEEKTRQNAQALAAQQQAETARQTALAEAKQQADLQAQAAQAKKLRKEKKKADAAALAEQKRKEATAAAKAEADRAAEELRAQQEKERQAQLEAEIKAKQEEADRKAKAAWQLAHDGRPEGVEEKKAAKSGEIVSDVELLDAATQGLLLNIAGGIAKMNAFLEIELFKRTGPHNGPSPKEWMEKTINPQLWANVTIWLQSYYRMRDVISDAQKKEVEDQLQAFDKELHKRLLLQAALRYLDKEYVELAKTQPGFSSPQKRGAQLRR